MRVRARCCQAPESVEEMRRYCAEVPGPKLANMLEHGKTPVLPPQVRRSGTLDGAQALHSPLPSRTANSMPPQKRQSDVPPAGTRTLRYSMAVALGVSTLVGARCFAHCAGACEHGLRAPLFAGHACAAAAWRVDPSPHAPPFSAHRRVSALTGCHALFCCLCGGGGRSWARWATPSRRTR
jgi:hypothetical protein